MKTVTNCVSMRLREPRGLLTRTRLCACVYRGERESARITNEFVVERKRNSLGCGGDARTRDWTTSESGDGCWRCLE